MTAPKFVTAGHAGRCQNTAIADPMTVAAEHVRWCREEGMEPHDVLASIRASNPDSWPFGWDGVVHEVALAWAAMQSAGQPRRARLRRVA